MTSTPRTTPRTPRQPRRRRRSRYASFMAALPTVQGPDAVLHAFQSLMADPALSAWYRSELAATRGANPEQVLNGAISRHIAKNLGMKAAGKVRLVARNGLAIKSYSRLR